MNIIIIVQIIITLLLLLETTTRLKFKDGVQFSVLTSSLVLLISTILNIIIISRINIIIQTAIKEQNTTIITILRPIFLLLGIIGDVIGKSNIPYLFQIILMLILYSLLKGYIRRLLESSRIIVPTVVPQPYYNPQSYQSAQLQYNPKSFTLGDENESISLADIEKIKQRNTKQPIKKLPQKITESTKLGIMGTVEFIGENKKLVKGENETDTTVIVPQTIQTRVRKIIQESDDETLSKEIMNKELKKKLEEEKEITKQLAQMIKTNINVELKINDQDTAWTMALDYLQGYIMDNLQLPPEIVLDQNRYRVIQVQNMSNQGYFKFTIEFFFSSNTIYYFDVYVFNDGSITVQLNNVLKY